MVCRCRCYSSRQLPLFKHSNWCFWLSAVLFWRRGRSPGEQHGDRTAPESITNSYVVTSQQWAFYYLFLYIIRNCSLIRPTRGAWNPLGSSQSKYRPYTPHPVGAPFWYSLIDSVGFRFSVLAILSTSIEEAFLSAYTMTLIGFYFCQQLKLPWSLLIVKFTFVLWCVPALLHEEILSLIQHKAEILLLLALLFWSIMVNNLL